MTGTPLNLPDWSEFERDYVASGIPHQFVVRAAPKVTLFVDQHAARLGARFETSGPPAGSIVAMLDRIHVDVITGAAGPAIEIWTDADSLYDNFYRLVCEIVIAVVDEGTAPYEALAAAVSRWEALLRRPSLLSDEAQAGLFGELWLLERLICAYGAGAVDSWTGPMRQPHDFRLGDTELEVKTTSGSGRVHTINGIGQLQPSLDCTLYLLSLRLADAGTGGRSLPEAVGAIEALLSISPTELSRFQTGLDAVGYDPTDASRYPRRRRLRDAAVLIEVADGVPRLTADALGAIDARFAPERLGRIVYAVDVEGLGAADGSDAFHAIIPPAVPAQTGDS